MKLESIEKLREYATEIIRGGKCRDVLDLTDEIEREISERYIELPVDADGVPIHVGDEIHVDEKLIGIDGGKKVYVAFVGNECFAAIEPFEYYDPSYCRHVKPDPIKELLEEFGNAVSKQGVDFDILDAVDEYATKLREVVGAE